MAQQVNPVPYENQTVFPYIMVDDVARLIAFLQSAFNAELIFKLNRNDGSVMHAEVKIGNSRIMTGEPTERIEAMPASIYVYVSDCDKVYEAALQAGAISIMKVTTMTHAGERYGGVKDFAGNIWWIASHVEDVTLEESQRRIKEMPKASE